MLKNLKSLRAEYGISQQKLADKIEMSQQSINGYENGVSEPDIQTLKLFADFFETSVDYIVGHTDIRQKIEKTEGFSLNEQEADLIQNYRRLSPKRREMITTLALEMLL